MTSISKHAKISIEKNLNGKWIMSGALYPSDQRYADEICCEGIGGEYNELEEAKEDVVKFCNEKYDIPRNAIEFYVIT